MESLVCLAEPILVLFVHTILVFIIVEIQNFFFKSKSFLHTYVGFCTCLSIVPDKQPAKSSATRSEPRAGDDSSLLREDVEITLSRMGLYRGTVGKQKVEFQGELSNLFADEEPSLEEVKAAFSVFDENGDGFIDELELQRVLYNLGIAEGSDLDACRRMIAAHDRNHDGCIDLNEFVNLMEISLC